MIFFYCGLSEQQWNYHPVAPGPLACVAPVSGRTLSTKQVNRVRVPASVAVIQESGAFSVLTIVQEREIEALSSPDASTRWWFVEASERTEYSE